MEKIRSVLVVDDDPDILLALTDALELEGYQVASASEGGAALEYLRAHPAPNVILLDWMMNGMDGATFVKHQSEDPVLKKIPVVLLTADARAGEKAAALNVASWLRKPVSLDELVKALEPFTKA